MKTREDALNLLKEYTKSESLLKHAFSVEAAVRGYAEHFGEDPLLWSMTGLLHDFDYERFPDPVPGGHPYVGVQILADQGYPEELCTAIMGHAKYTGVARDSKLAKTLFACDELCGLVMASTLVRPDRSIANLEVSSVKKKMKDKAFARGVDREDIILGTQELGVELEDHIARVISSMRGISSILF